MKRRDFLLASLMGQLFFLPLMLVLSLITLSADLAAQGRVVAQAPVDISIKAKFSLRLRIGSPGGRIDVVRFSVSELPGSGQIQGISSGPNPVPVKAKARFSSGQMILTADSSIPLEDGAGNTIPFSEIGWVGTGGMPSGTFSNAADQVIMATSSSNFNGAMSFYYGNILYVPSGVYTSRVVYTLSSP
jgi:hypothetical protein